MISHFVLVMVIIALVTVAALATALLMLHAARLEARDGRLSEPLAQGRHTLISSISGIEPLSEDDVCILRKLPRQSVVALVSEISRSVIGNDPEAITQISAALDLTASAESMVRSRLWWRRIEGTRTLSLFDPNSSLRSVLLTDRHPLVRARAAEWSGAGAPAADIKILVSLLEDNNGLTRFSAKDALIRLGTAAAPLVADRLNQAEGTLADSLLEVAGSVNDPRFMEGALRLINVESARTRALAADLLGALGGSEAQSVLGSLLSDENDMVRASAARGLGQLGHWRAAPSLALCLEDPSWHVRRAAGTSLRSLGAPGLLLLRKVLASSDPFAADMAHQVLDIRKLDERLSA